MRENHVREIGGEMLFFPPPPSCTLTSAQSADAQVLEIKSGLNLELRAGGPQGM